MELFKNTCRYGLNPSEFWDLTPEQLYYAQYGLVAKQEDFINSMFVFCYETGALTATGILNPSHFPDKPTTISGDDTEEVTPGELLVSF